MSPHHAEVGSHDPERNLRRTRRDFRCQEVNPSDGDEPCIPEGEYSIPAGLPGAHDVVRIDHDFVGEHTTGSVGAPPLCD